jgi:hypothetical protein
MDLISMKKSLLFLICAIAVLYLIYTILNPQNVYEAAAINPKDITKIVFYDGRGGRNEPVTVEDKRKIEEFLNLLDGYTVREYKNPKLSVGWIHCAVFYKGSERLMEMTFVNPLIINKQYYRIIKGNLSPERIGKFLKSINPDYKINL